MAVVTCRAKRMEVESHDEHDSGYRTGNRTAVVHRARGSGVALLARRFGLNALDDSERAELISSLEEAERDIQEGRTHTAEELRRAVSEWAGG